MKTWLACAACALGATASAEAGLFFFTFDDPSTPLETTFTFGDVEGNNGSITYDATVPLTLAIDGSDAGMGVSEVEANLTMSLVIDAAMVSESPFLFALGTISGTFEFTRVSDGESILSAQVNEGLVNAAGTSGSFFSNSTIDQDEQGDLGLDFTAGPVLQDMLGEALELFPIYDASFTLTNIRDTGDVDNNGNTLYAANTAFTATSNSIPAPGAVALVGIAGLCAAPRRRVR
ncbi:MAG: hypothetical protein AAGD00_02645 [Planctomycetota bacterium]